MIEWHALVVTGTELLLGKLGWVRAVVRHKMQYGPRRDKSVAVGSSESGSFGT